MQFCKFSKLKTGFHKRIKWCHRVWYLRKWKKKKRWSQYVVFEFSRVGVFEFETFVLVFFVHLHKHSPLMKGYNLKKYNIFTLNQTSNFRQYFFSKWKFLKFDNFTRVFFSSNYQVPATTKMSAPIENRVEDTFIVCLWFSITLPYICHS